MKSISKAEFEIMIEHANVLEQGRRGPRVFLTPDQRIVKLFYSTRLISSNRIWPYARRFNRNSNRLNALNIRSVHVDQMVHCSAIKADIVAYPLIRGESLRDITFDDPRFESVIAGFADFLACMQHKGVHFKGLHLGNVLYDKEFGYALIDVDYVQFFRWPLGIRHRVVNFLRSLRYDEDKKIFDRFGMPAFLELYLAATKLTASKRHRLLRAMQKQSDSILLQQSAASLINH